MRAKLLIILLVALWAWGCGNASREFPGYSVNPNGIHYRLIALGEGQANAQPTDYITVGITYRTRADSIFFSATRRFQLGQPQFPGAIDECFAMLRHGDSASFYIDASSFFNRTLETDLPPFIHPGEYMRVEVRMLDVQTEAQYLQEKEAFLHWIEDFGHYEKVILRQYVEQQELDIQPTPSGIYYIPVTPGHGHIIQPGDTVTVHFEGRFFNGRFFDSTKQRNEPFQFVYGQRWQVIEGLEEAIGMMRPAERAIFIIPSRLAFGEGGSSTGIVPPFTSVVFEVEILDVKPALHDASL